MYFCVRALISLEHTFACGISLSMYSLSASAPTLCNTRPLHLMSHFTLSQLQRDAAALRTENAAAMHEQVHS